MCKAPKTNPETIINKILFGIIFLIPPLNTNSSTLGASNTADIYTYIGCNPNKSLIVSSLPAKYYLFYIQCSVY